MAQLSEKELSSIQELLADEDLLVKKFKMLAEHSQDEKVRSKMLEISDKHQRHFNDLYSKLSQGVEAMAMIYTEKEILGDALSTQKATTELFNKASNECVHEDVRETILDILEEEHEIQQDVFCMMHAQGMYPTPDADQKKVQQLKQQYQACAKQFSDGGCRACHMALQQPQSRFL